MTNPVEVALREELGRAAEAIAPNESAVFPTQEDHQIPRRAVLALATTGVLAAAAGVGWLQQHQVDRPTHASSGSPALGAAPVSPGIAIAHDGAVRTGGRVMSLPAPFLPQRILAVGSSVVIEGVAGAEEAMVFVVRGQTVAAVEQLSLPVAVSVGGRFVVGLERQSVADQGSPIGRTLLVVDLANQEVVSRTPVAAGLAPESVLDAQARRVVVTDVEGNLRVVDTVDDRVQLWRIGGQQATGRVAVDSRGEMAYLTATSGRVKAVSLGTDRHVWERDLQASRPVVISPDGASLAFARGQSIAIAQASSGEVVSTSRDVPGLSPPYVQWESAQSLLAFDPHHEGPSRLWRCDAPTLACVQLPGEYAGLVLPSH